MTLQAKKPKNMDEFIKGAKAETKPAETEVTPAIPQEAGQVDEYLLRSYKTFPLKIHTKLLEKAKEKASKETPKVSLHDYLIRIIAEKVDKD